MPVIFIRQFRFGKALGWFVQSSGTYLQHTGQTLGFRCFCDIDLQAKVAVVALCNTATALIDYLRRPIIDILRTGQCGSVRFPIPPVVSVNSKALLRLTGTYLHESQPGLSLIIRHDHGTLTAQFVLDSKFPQVKLYPYSETDFFYRAKPRHFHFVLNSHGQADRVVITADMKEIDKTGTYIKKT